MSSALPTTRIIVSSNGEQYRVVEITGAQDGACVRERILSKLCIPDERHARFLIFRSQVGAYGIGDPLGNAVLYEYCQQYGDASGSLIFFVSTARDRPPSKYEPDGDLMPSRGYPSNRRYSRKI